MPPSHLEATRDAVFAAGGGWIGDYSRCSWSTLGRGTFRGGEGTHPAVGEAGQDETVAEYRYDMGTDTVVGRAPILEYDRCARFRQIRLNTKIDAPLPRPEYDLDAFYRGRRWLTEWLNDPAHQVTFRLEPGDVMFMDNLRVLHGRTAFDSAKGVRHLQGAYIDHDGPDTMYRLAVRSLQTEGSR